MPLQIAKDRQKRGPSSSAGASRHGLHRCPGDDGPGKFPGGSSTEIAVAVREASTDGGLFTLPLTLAVQDPLPPQPSWHKLCTSTHETANYFAKPSSLPIWHFGTYSKWTRKLLLYN